jgi:hypothetical protein
VEIDKGEISFMCCFRMYYKSTVQMCKYDGFFHFRLADIFRKYLLIVKRAGITIYVVFDGLLLPAKASEVEQRQR